MALEAELRQQIKKKKLDEVEAAWISRADESPRDLGWFLEVARELRAVKAQVRLAELISYLVDTLGEAGAWKQAFDALREGISLVPRNKDLRVKAVENIRARHAQRADVEEVLAFFGLEEAENPLRAFDEMREWLRFTEGEGFWLFGRGLGKVVEINLALQKVKLRFEKAGPLVVRRDEARKLLTWIPGDHFMMRRLKDPEGVRKEAKSDPGDMVRRLLECFGRPLTASEIRECMTGVVEGGAWAAWWSRARGHSQVLPSKERKGTFVFTGTSEEAEERILGEFAGARPDQRVELARRYGKRKGVRAQMLEGLRTDLRRLAPSRSPLAIEIAFLLEEFGGLPDPSPLDLDEILRSTAAVDRIAGVGDRRYRERLYRRVRDVRPDDWPEVAHAAFFREPDLRLLSTIYEMLRDDGPEEACARLVAEAVSSPRKAPSAFVWVTKNSLVREELAGRANPALLSKVVDALEGDEFREMQAHLREQFDEGGLAFVVFEGCDLEGADHLLTLIDGSGLEEHRKTGIRREIFRKYPHIRKRSAQEQDALWATREAVEAKRQELEHLVRTEIPENTEAIRVAREYGDLSENFEYHAARQKHELLSTRAARLQKELRRARVIDPSVVDSSEVGLGTRVTLERLDGSPGDTLTILGPWDSDPDARVYSHQSEFAKRVLGKHPGDVVDLDSVELRIARIEVWKSPDEAVEPSGAE